MTASRALPRDEYCAQHRQPRSECEPWDRHGHTMRFREDMWQQAEATASADKSDVTTFLTEAAEAMLGYARCHRCPLGADPVPLEYGDLQGRPLREWVADAVKKVQKQHPRHEPVWIGAEPSGPAQVVFRPPTPAVVLGGKKGRAGR